MDKQKQIEELGRMIRVALEYGDFSHLNIHDKDRFLTGRSYIATAENLYEAGYRKIPENDEKQVIECHGMLKGCDIVKQAVKDTAKEIYGEIDDSDILIVNTQEYGEIEVVPIERLKEIIKQKGVEVE